MNFETMRDVLKRSEDFHNALSAQFKQIGDKEKQEKVKMLLDYLSRHEDNLAKAVKEYSSHAHKEVMDTWFQYTSAPLPVDSEIRENMSFDEIVEKAMKFDDCVVDLYSTIAREADIPEVREVTQNLLEMENEEQRRRARSIAELQDM